MREIKFRAWNTRKGRMALNVHEMYDTLGSRCVWADDGKDVTPCSAFVDFLDDPEQWVVEQWTGLQDSNGVDIYEGDLVRVDRTHGTGIEGVGPFSDIGPMPVVFVNGSFTLGDDGYYFWDYATGSPDQVFVVGNIHETGKD